MSVEFESAKRLDALKQGIEAKTGETYDDLTGGVNALIAGYGQGGGGEDEGIIFLEKDSIFFNLPKKVKLNVTLRQSVENTYGFAFANASGASGLFSRMTEVFLPDGIVWISHGMFKYCTLLDTIHADFSNVEHIGVEAFFNCTSMTELPYFPNLVDVRPKAFANCTNLVNAKFFSVLSVVASADMFNGCVNLTDIYVPWEEGAVANAPWGATNATIHYNTVYDDNGDPIV